MTICRVKGCTVCRQEWTVKTRYQAARNQTCSPKCSAVWMSRVMKGRRWAPVRKATCLHCRVEFVIPAYRGDRPQKYCSHSCRAKANAAHLIPFANNGKGKKRPGKGLAGPLNPAWKGGVTIFKKKGNYVGVRYVRAPEWAKPMARGDGYIMEHRLIMAEWCGFLMTRTEVVNHINHDPTNNTRANLELWPTNADHKRGEFGRCVPGVANRLSLTDSAQR